MLNKRGQVTIFIIVAIILLAIVGIFFILNQDTEGTTGDVSSDPVYIFVEKCIENTAIDALYVISQSGGYFLPTEFSNEEGIAYYYANNRNYMPSKEKIETEISWYINEMLYFCTEDFVNFSEYNINPGEIKTRALIKDYEIVLNVEYPLSITKGEETSILKNWDAIKIPSRLGVIYNSIKQLIDEQMGREDICLSCNLEIALENSLTIDMENYDENEVIFIIKDQTFSLEESFFEFKFVNKY